MQFRAATLSDMDDIIAMRIAYLKEINTKMTKKELNALLTHLPDYYRRHMEKDFFAYLALENEAPVSTVFLLVIERPASFNFITGKTGILLNVYTIPACRRRGLASVLVSMALADAKKQNVSGMELQATDMGIPVYEKLGFRHKESQYTHMEYRFDAPNDNAALPS